MSRKKLVTLIQLITAMAMAISFVISTWLPTWFLIIGLTISLGVIGTAITRLRVWVKVVLIILSLSITVSLIYAQQSLIRLLNNETNETSIMDFYVASNSDLRNLDEVLPLNFGISDQVDEVIRTSLIEDIMNQNPQAQWINADNDHDLVNQLLTGDIDVWVVDHSLVDTLLEWDPALLDKVTLIYSTEKNFVKPDIAKDVDTSKETFIILLSGVDTRGTISSRSRSDVNILLVVNPNSYDVLTVSIPRDSYVDLACKNNAKDKLTHAGVYGIGCSVSTIEQLFDIDINYYIKLNFTSFIKVVDVLGSINVYSQYSFTTSKYVSYDKSYTFTTGMNKMNAEQALFFSRERHAFENGDVQRGLNQQQVIKGLINKLIEPATLAKIDRIITTTSKAIDTNLTSTQLNELIKLQLEKNPAWNFTSNYLKGQTDYQPTYSMGSRKLFVYWPDALSVQEIHNQIEMIRSRQSPTINEP